MPTSNQHDHDLIPCPFCESVPSFSRVEEKDERRYMRMALECCVTMTAGIGYSKYVGMSDEAIESELKAELVGKWNARALPEHLAENDPHEASWHWGKSENGRLTLFIGGEVNTPAEAKSEMMTLHSVTLTETQRLTWITDIEKSIKKLGQYWREGSGCSTGLEEIKQWLSSAGQDQDVSKNSYMEALGHLRGLVEFSYEQGFHELGYDPLAVVMAYKNQADDAGAGNQIQDSLRTGLDKAIVICDDQILFFDSHNRKELSSAVAQVRERIKHLKSNP